MATVAQLLQEARAQLQEAGVESYPLDARLLLVHTTGWSAEQLIGYPERDVPFEQEKLFRRLVARRIAREPLAHLTGEREFWGLPFKVTPATLIPRPESEALIELALSLVKANEWHPAHIADFGTGSGCLLLSLLHEWPGATGIGVDLSKDALDCAAENAQNLKIANRCQWLVSNWAEALHTDARFDVIVSNPPYVAEGERAGLQPEVGLFEPENALFAGKDGLEAYKKLAKQVSRCLTKRGFVLLESGAGQARSIQHIFQEAGWSLIATQDDLLGIERALAFSRQMP
jgi:release factor glutamine methyltransferase